MNVYKRKQYLIDVPYQTQFMFKFSALVALTSFLVGLFIFFLTQGSTTVAIEKTRIYVKPTSDFILPVLCLTVISVAVIAAVVVMAMTLFISHRIVGPIFRLKNQIGLIKNGSLKRNFTTREKDQLKDLAKCLQDMSDALLGRHEQLKKDYALLAGFLQKEGAVNKEELKRIVDQIGANLDHFKV